VLYSQKIQLTNEEYNLLEDTFQNPSDPTKVNYISFNDQLEIIFTEKGLEKDPTKRLQEFKAPSILDPKDVLNNDEERVLDNCLSRVGTDVRYRRLLLKPFF